MNNSVKGIYVHIPFCKDICYYCNFYKGYYDYNTALQYIKALKYEVEQYSIDNMSIESIYIGGGTPSVLDIDLLEELLLIFNSSIYSSVQEFTVEVNPDSITKEKALILKKYGVNRISIGVQTFNNELLQSINRSHTREQSIECIEMLQDIGLTNISVDLMYGFNNQSLQTLKEDLHKLIYLNIQHISTYSLIIEDGTVYSNQKYIKDEDLDYEYELYINKFLIDNGFEHYEVSNYSKNNTYSRHNLLYWNFERYFGFGMGASGYIENYRYYNTKSITNYNQLLFNVKYDYYQNNSDLLKDAIMLQFRIYNGIDITLINSRFNIDFNKYFAKAIEKNLDNIYFIDNKLYFKQQAKLFLNNIIIDFIYVIKE